MNKLGLSFLLGAAVAGVSSAQLFPVDSFIVQQLGGNTSAGQSISLKGFKFDGTATNSVNVTTTLSNTGLGNFVGSGSASSEGIINAGSSALALSGYDAQLSTASVSSASGISRRVVTFNNLAANFNTAFSVANLDSGYVGNNFRSSYVDTVGGSIYTAGTGTGGGWRKYDSAGVFQSQLNGASSLTNTRVIKQINGKFYGTAQSGATGLANLTDSTDVIAIPTTGATRQSFYDFDLVNGYWIMTDDANGLSVYNAAGTQVGASLTGFKGRSISVRNVDPSTGKFDIYGVDSARTTVQKFSLDLSTLNSPVFGSLNTVATADTGTVFTGVELVPEPASMLIIAAGLVGLARRRRK